MSLVELKASPDLLMDIRYATADNFTGKPVYQSARCFLHEEAAAKLKRAMELAAAHGLIVKVFDAFRPIEVQQALWNHTPDPEFLSEPGVGSTPHCRGVAVDLTLVDKKTGKELDMGTGFDEFTPRSHHGNLEISAEAQKNRYLLMGIMTTAGWDFYRNEWWHYQLFNARNYPVVEGVTL